MEFASSIMTSMAGAMGGGGGAAKAGSDLGGGSIVGSILSGGASLLQMSALRAAGRQKAMDLTFQSQDTATEIAQENIQATGRQNGLRQALLDTIGERDAAYAASGVDIGFGTPALARQEASASAESAIAQDAAGTNARVSRLNAKAQNLLIMARQARRSADAEATTVGLSAVGRLLARG
jgi:hypothetical protein